MVVDIEKYSVLVGIASPTEIIKLTMLKLEKDVHSWWR